MKSLTLMLTMCSLLFSFSSLSHDASAEELKNIKTIEKSLQALTDAVANDKTIVRTERKQLQKAMEPVLNADLDTARHILKESSIKVFSSDNGKAVMKSPRLSEKLENQINKAIFNAVKGSSKKQILTGAAVAGVVTLGATLWYGRNKIGGWDQAIFVIIGVPVYTAGATIAGGVAGYYLSIPSDDELIDFSIDDIKKDVDDVLNLE